MSAGGVMFALDLDDEEPAKPRKCSTCKHHAKPQWATGGFGTCGHVVRLGLVKTIGSTVLKGASAGYVATHDDFACQAWTDPSPPNRDNAA